MTVYAAERNVLQIRAEKPYRVGKLLSGKCLSPLKRAEKLKSDLALRGEDIRCARKRRFG